MHAGQDFQDMTSYVFPIRYACSVGIRAIRFEFVVPNLMRRRLR